MKQNTVIIAAVGAILLLSAAILVYLNLPSLSGTGVDGNAGISSNGKVPSKADAIEKLESMKGKISIPGASFAGGALQLINGEETAMVYIYKPVGIKDTSDLLAEGFTAVYSVFDTKDPLLVGLVDTTEKISSTQYRVDIYALERLVVSDYLKGNLTKSELVKKALWVTPETKSLRGDSTIKQSLDVNYDGNMARKFIEPPDRRTYAIEMLNKSGYNVLNLATGKLQTGEQVVSFTVSMKEGATIQDKYDEMEAIFKACAGAYGDYDRYAITLAPASGSEYYIIDTSAYPVLDYLNGDISQWKLFNRINMTYYTK